MLHHRRRGTSKEEADRYESDVVSRDRRTESTSSVGHSRANITRSGDRGIRHAGTKNRHTKVSRVSERREYRSHVVSVHIVPVVGNGDDVSNAGPGAPRRGKAPSPPVARVASRIIVVTTRVPGVYSKTTP